MDDEILNTESVPCSICGRKFLSDRLDKHMTICLKMKESQKKRKTFDSSKQRAADEQNGYGTVQKSTVPSSSSSSSTVSSSVKSVKSKSNWKQQHEEFIRTIRAARGEKVEDDDKDNDVPRVPVGYIKCDTCGRHFSSKAADRHIEWCREQKARVPRKNNNNEALQRVKTRTNYKAPDSTPKSVASSPKKEKSAKNPQSINENTDHVNVGSRKKPPVGSKKRSPASGTSNRINSLSKPKKLAPSVEEKIKMNKTPVMKFKEKFPNHITNGDKYFENEQIKEMMKRTTEAYGSAPRTVPGVRTGGTSPTKQESAEITRKYIDSDNNDQDFAKLKARIEEMYIHGNTKYKPTNTPKKSEMSNDGLTLTRVSTSESSDGSSGQPNSSDGFATSNGGMPKFCHQCGTKYPVTVAKYCYECGSRRLGTVGPFLAN